MSVIASLDASNGGADDNSAQAGHLVAASIGTRPYADNEAMESRLVTHTLSAEGHDASEDGTGRGALIVVQNGGCFDDGDLYKCGDCLHAENHREHPAACPECGNADYENVMIRPKMGPNAGKAFDFDGDPQGYVAGTLNSGGNNGGFRTEPGEHLVASPIAYKVQAKNANIKHTDAIETPISNCLDSVGFTPNQGGTVIAYRTAGDGAVYDEGDMAAPLTTQTDPSSMIVFDERNVTSAENRSNPQSGDPCHTLHASPPTLAVTPIDMRQASRGEKMTNNRAEGSSGGAPGTGIGEEGDPAPTIGVSHPPAVAFRESRPGGVRRLTPMECERLQGLPDGWTAWGLDENGKRVEMSDSARYRMIGNAVTKTVGERLGERFMALVNG